MTLDVAPAEDEEDKDAPPTLEELLWELLVGERRRKVDPRPEKSS